MRWNREVTYETSDIALSLAFLVGLFALSGSATHAYAFNNSSDQAQLTASGSYRTVAWHRYWRDDHDFDRPYVRHYYYDYYDPYYDYPYPIPTVHLLWTRVLN